MMMPSIVSVLRSLFTRKRAQRYADADQPVHRRLHRLHGRGHARASPCDAAVSSAARAASPGRRPASRCAASFTTWPSRKLMTRDAKAAISCSCVTSTTVIPPRFNCCSSPISSKLVRVSSAPVGSSARISTGSLTSARAIATRCCWPPESCEGWWSARSARPTSASRASARCRRSSSGQLAVEQRQLDVLDGGGAREQIEVLEDEADAAVADRRQRVARELRNLLARERCTLRCVGASRQPSRFIGKPAAATGRAAANRSDLDRAGSGAACWRAVRFLPLQLAQALAGIRLERIEQHERGERAPRRNALPIASARGSTRRTAEEAAFRRPRQEPTLSRARAGDRDRAPSRPRRAGRAARRATRSGGRRRGSGSPVAPRRAPERPPGVPSAQRSTRVA